MTPLVKKIVVSAFLLEAILFLMLYYFGPNGRHVAIDLSGQKILLQSAIQQLHQDVKELEDAIAIARTDFAKETIARERLLMKKDNEIIYFRK